MTQKDSVQIPWAFLGGYFLFFIGLGAGVFGAFEFSGMNGHAPKDHLPGLMIAGLGIALSATGSWMMANVEQIRGNQFSGLIVMFVMTPLPAILGVGINYLGARLRKPSSTTWSIALLGASVFFLVLAGNWCLEASALRTGRPGFRSMMWVLLAEIGVDALILALAPLLRDGSHAGTTEAPANLPEAVTPA